MTATPILPLNVDATIVNTFRSCPMRMYNEFVLGLRPKAKSIHLHAGGCFSKGIEATGRNLHEQKKPLAESLKLAHLDFAKEWGTVEVPDEEAKSYVKVWNAVEQYFVEYPPISDRVQPLFVTGQSTFEHSFAIPLEPCSDKPWGESGVDPCFPFHPNGGPFLYSGRFDMLGLLDGKIPCVRDEKTASQQEHYWSDKWNLRSQFMGYVWACQQHGLSLDTVIVRGVILTKKSPPRFPQAIKTYSKLQIDRWYEQLRRDLWRIRRAWDEGYWDYNFGETCTNYGLCPYMTMCLSRNPENWHSDFKIERWNPVAANPEGGVQ